MTKISKPLATMGTGEGQLAGSQTLFVGSVIGFQHIGCKCRREIFILENDP